jgi:hypothetical protein
VNGAAAAAGPIIGGLLTQAFSWRWVFFVNLPVSVLAIAVSARVLPRERLGGNGRGRGRIDIPGVLAFTIAAGTVTAAVTRGVGLATGALAAAALATVPADRGGVASGALNTARQLGYALGIAALGLVCKGAVADRLTGTVGEHGSGAAARAVTGGQAHALIAGAPPRARANLDLAIHSAFAHGLDLTLLAAGGAGLAAAAIVALALRQRRTVEPAVA